MATIEDIVKTITEVCPPTAEEDVTNWNKRFIAKNITKDFIGEFAKTEEAKTSLFPFVDQRVQQGIKTFEEGAFEEKVKTRVETRLRELNPNETEDQKRARAEKERADKLEGINKKSDLLNKGILYLMTKNYNIPERALKAFVASATDEQELVQLIEDLAARDTLTSEKITNDVLRKHNIVPKSGDAVGKYATKADLERALKSGVPYGKEEDEAYKRLYASK
jgi:hypothetical protein